MKSLILQCYQLMCVMIGAFIGMAGAFAPSVAIWGPTILSTAMGPHPNRHHPAFLLGLVLLGPRMVFGIAAGFFILFMPVAMRFPTALDSARCFTTPSQIALIRRYTTKLLEYLEKAERQLDQSKRPHKE